MTEAYLSTRLYTSGTDVSIDNNVKVSVFLLVNVAYYWHMADNNYKHLTELKSIGWKYNTTI